jgi:hypothetical protein
MERMRHRTIGIGGMAALAVLLAGGLMAALVLGTAPPVAGASTPLSMATGWSTVPGALDTTLYDVSCTPDQFCAAVGAPDATTTSGVEEWNGSSWVASPDPAVTWPERDLRSVSCVNSSFCMAVGETENPSTFDTSTLIEYWNGAQWSVSASPAAALADSELSSVSCASTAWCMAVGETSTPDSPVAQTVTDVWNGTSWSEVQSPDGTGQGSGLVSLSCPTTSFCMALGQTLGTTGAEVPLALQWNGATWTVPSLSAGSPPIGSVSCPTTTSCMAASDNTYTEWNGSSWTTLPTTETSDDDEAQGVTCVTMSFCLSVGSRNGHQTTYYEQTLAREWNGSTWDYIPTQDATADSNNVLSGVSCTTTVCFAVGGYADDLNGEPHALIEESTLSTSSSSSTPSSGGAPVSAPIVGMASTPDGNGYWLVGSDGTVYNYGDALNYGSATTDHLKAPIVGMASTLDGGGYWLVASDGGIFAFGDAVFYGSTGALHLNKPIVGMAVTPDGGGYWFVASDGGIFSFGDATFYGSMGSTHLNAPVVGMAADYFSGGYWLVASDGGIFSFNAPFFGSTGALHLNKPIVGMEASSTGTGYRFVASDGGIFSFNLPFSGSMGGSPLNQPIVAMAASGTNGLTGYWMTASDGGLFSFGGAPFEGSPA